MSLTVETGNVIVYNSINMLRNGSSDYGFNQLFDNSENSKRNGNNHHMEEIEDTLTICSSTGSSLSLNKPFCKICHIGSTKNGDKLISPCKCSGTMQYIHCGCLLKWLEISNRTNEKPMSCELCAHEYTWHKKFNYKEAKMPKCSLKDVIYHLIFIAAIGVMFLSAIAPMMYKKSHEQATMVATTEPQTSTNSVNHKHTNHQATDEQQATSRRHHAAPPTLHHGTFNGQMSNHLPTSSRLAHDEKFMLLCAASFFISFFLAIYVQTKARYTLYGLFIKFLAMNQTYYITEYDHGQLNPNASTTVNSSNGNSSSEEQHQNNHHENCSENSRADRKSSEKS